MADAGEGDGQIMGGIELNRIRPKKNREKLSIYISQTWYMLAGVPCVPAASGRRAKGGFWFFL